MSDVFAKQAEMAAERVDEVIVEEMGFTEITSILTQAFTFLTSCLNRENQEPAQIQAAVRDENTANPTWLLRRTARRIRSDSDAPMTKSQSFALARASIEQALAMEPETAMACIAAVPDVSF